jgi:hypothetical protein
VGAGVMAGMGGGGAARTAGNSEELAVEWACAVGAASGDWGSGCAGDAVVANAFKSFGLGSRCAAVFEARHGWLGRCWDGRGELLRRWRQSQGGCQHCIRWPFAGAALLGGRGGGC